MMNLKEIEELKGLLTDSEQIFLFAMLTGEGYSHEITKNSKGDVTGLKMCYATGSTVGGHSVTVRFVTYHSYDSTQYYARIELHKWFYDGDDLELDNNFSFSCPVSMAYKKIHELLEF